MFDEELIYASGRGRVRAISRATGEEVWEAKVRVRDVPTVGVAKRSTGSAGSVRQRGLLKLGADDDADHDEGSEEINSEGLEVKIKIPAHDRRPKIRVEAYDNRCHGKDNEATRDELVKQSGVGIAPRSILCNSMFDYQLETFPGAIEARERKSFTPAAKMSIDAVSSYQCGW